MTSRGRLTRDNVAFSMPAAGGLYPPGDIVCRGVEVFTVEYQTTTEALCEFVPDILDVPEPATVFVTVLDIPRDSLGSFREVQVLARVELDGGPRRYQMFLYVTEDVPLAHGREYLGTPKKIGHVGIRREGVTVIGTLHRPRTVHLLTAFVAPDRVVGAEEADDRFSPALAVRRMPAPEGSAQLDAVELVEMRSSYQVIEKWTGGAGLRFGAASTVDPLYRLPIVRVVGGTTSRMDIVAPGSKAVKVL